MSSITLLGAGNLATHLAISLHQAGHTITQVFSKTKKSAQLLSNRLNCPYTTDLKSILPSDIAIIAVNDDAIKEVEKHIFFPKIHTSGSTSIDCLNGKNTGVLYPIQSFSKNKTVDLSETPICIEANNDMFLQQIETLARSLSTYVLPLESQQRGHLHLSAVMACNFSTLMYVLAEEICSKHAIPFDLLHPLIEETAKKVVDMNPSTALTGPAKRGDDSVMKQHAHLLESDQEKKQIYQLLSRSIAKRNL